MKTEIVIPIPKVCNSYNVSDPRPISLLPLPGKLIERFVHQNLLDRIEVNELISEDQYGFRPGHSTTDAISTLTDNIGINMNNNQLTP